MPKKVIQVPIDERLLKDLDNLSKKQHQARSELIRQACLHYLREIEYEELDRAYQEGYMRIPEEPTIGEAQLAMLDEVIAEEAW